MRFLLSSRPQAPSPTARRQRGSIVVNATIALSLVVIALVGTELGYLFFMKREFQKAVDLAALSGAQKFTPYGSNDGCTDSKSTAVASAALNLPGVPLGTLECGRWAPELAGEDHFVAGTPQPNALRVAIVAAPPVRLLPFFDANRTIAVRAVASRAAPVAAFTVGSRLLRLEGGTLLPNLLKTAGLDLGSADLLSYRGLANASIKPSGLLDALDVPVSSDLDVGTLSAVASIADLSVGGLLDASITALQKQGPAIDAQLAVLQSLRAGLGAAMLATRVPLFGNGTTPGILVGLDSTGADALSADVDLLSLVTTTLGVANGRNLIALDNLSVGILGVQAKASIIEPPSIGIGGTGTVAKTAQVRVYLRVNTSTSIVGSILGIVGTQVDLPLVLELAQSTGTLGPIDCRAPRKTTTVAVSSSQANVCVGRFNQMTSVSDPNPLHFFHTANRCTPGAGGTIPDSADGVRRHQLLSVLGVMPLSVRVGLPVLESQSAVVTPLLQEPVAPSDGAERATVTAAHLDVARSAANISDAIAVGVLGDLLGQGAVATPAARKTLAEGLVGTGNGGRGRSITDVGNEMRWSAQAVAELQASVANGGLTGLLGGVLQGVGNTLGSVLLDPLADVVCNLAGLGAASAVHACRVDYVQNNTLKAGSNLLSSTLTLVLAILDPLLDLLSTALVRLLGVLGLSLGETDVNLLSIDCGTSKLVY